MNSTNIFREVLFGPTARRTLQTMIAVAALIPAIAAADDLPYSATHKAAADPSMEHGMAMPVIPASLTWVMTAPAGSRTKDAGEAVFEAEVVEARVEARSPGAG